MQNSIISVLLYCGLASEYEKASDCDVRRIESSKISAEELKGLGQPVLLTGALDASEKAWRQWTASKISAELGNARIAAKQLHPGSVAGKRFRDLSLADVLEGRDPAVAKAYPESGGGVSAYFFQPNHPLSQAVGKDVEIPPALRAITAFGPSASYGQVRSYTHAHRHEV
eukprot:TRINITY_DN33806_c0_g1_i2.p1 TRINITY_DN33806_c0_g1~~TRINITY_DN33806_c0_g1_i2.p1  ORF type:complete len:170 (+),score=35.04 TRINITY_DN33806_c0_g1_i2:39-548(+)